MIAEEAARLDKGLESLVEVTEAILRGDFDRDVSGLNVEGVLQELASRINSLLANMKSVEIPLINAGEQAPTLVDKAVDVVDLMKKTAGKVLDKSDLLSELMGALEQRIIKENGDAPVDHQILEDIDHIKNSIFDIIATQTFQDVARQKMEVMIRDMNQMRDWLVESLLVLNLKKDDSPENIQQKTNLLRDVKDGAATEKDKQDLVDDLLAEFGF